MHNIISEKQILNQNDTGGFSVADAQAAVSQYTAGLAASAQPPNQVGGSQVGHLSEWWNEGFEDGRTQRFSTLNTRREDGTLNSPSVHVLPKLEAGSIAREESEALLGRMRDAVRATFQRLTGEGKSTYTSPDPQRPAEWIRPYFLAAANAGQTWINELGATRAKHRSEKQARDFVSAVKAELGVTTDELRAAVALLMDPAVRAHLERVKAEKAAAWTPSPTSQVSIPEVIAQKS